MFVILWRVAMTCCWVEPNNKMRLNLRWLQKIKTFTIADGLSYGSSEGLVSAKMVTNTVDRLPLCQQKKKWVRLYSYSGVVLLYRKYFIYHFREYYFRWKSCWQLYERDKFWELEELSLLIGKIMLGLSLCIL